MKVSCFVTYAKGRLTFDRHVGFSPCVLWADVRPLSQLSPEEPAIGSVWVESDFDSTCYEIREDWNNQTYLDACCILERNDDWWTWASDEIKSQIRDYAVNKRLDDAKHGVAT